MPSYLHEDDPLPERTTPQGTQAHGVEHGHEERDVDYRALTKWFIGLGVGIAVILPLVWFAYQVTRPMIEGTERLPSRVFAERWDLPLPRVLPNPLDSPPDRIAPLPQPLIGPARFHVQQQRAENEALVRLGLRYPDDPELGRQAGRPRLPERAVEAVIAAAGKGAAARPADGAATDGLQEMMPSGASGGIRMENRLR